MFAAELIHRGNAIREALTSRRAVRSSRRNRETRYRKCRFDRSKPSGWLPPSLMSRVHNIMTWVERLLRICPITAISGDWAWEPPNMHDLPIRHRTRCKRFYGFQTGDMVRAILPSGKFAGTHVGRLTVRKTGVFEINTSKSKVAPVRHKYCQSVHKNDGYMYTFSTVVH